MYNYKNRKELWRGFMLRKLIVFMLSVLMSVTLVSTVCAAEKTQWNFDDDNIDGWVEGGANPNFTGENGEIIMVGDDAWLISPLRRQNFILEANITQQTGHSGLIFRANADGSARSVVIISAGLVKYFSFPDYSGTVTEITDIPIEFDTPYKLKIAVNNDSLKVWVDDKLAMTKTIKVAIDNQDYMGVFQYGGTATVDNFNVSVWNESGIGVAPTATIAPTATNIETKTANPVTTKLATPTPAKTNENNEINKIKEKPILPIIIIASILVVGSAITFIIMKKKKD